MRTDIADAVALKVAEQCCTGKKRNGSPKAPVRYAIIYQAARLGAIGVLRHMDGEKE